MSAPTAVPPPAPGEPLPTPALRRRLACLLYESVLVFAVVFFAALIYSVLTEQRHALAGRHGLTLVAFVLAPGAYFTWYWSQTGQTLPMQTWRIRVLTVDGQRLSRARALLRFLAAWLWLLPALLLAWLAGWHGSGWRLSLLLIAGAALYALSSRLQPQRQFWHDVLCRTRLVDTRALPATASTLP